MPATCSEIKKINKLEINMAKFEAKLDAANATSERIEQKIDQQAELQREEMRELKQSFNSTLQTFAEDIKQQITAHISATTTALKEQEKSNATALAGKADKWIEKATVKAIWIIVTPILGGVGYFLYKILTSPVMGSN